jgi:hypothetical protein
MIYEEKHAVYHENTLSEAIECYGKVYRYCMADISRYGELSTCGLTLETISEKMTSLTLKLKGP